VLQPIGGAFPAALVASALRLASSGTSRSRAERAAIVTARAECGRVRAVAHARPAVVHVAGAPRRRPHSAAAGLDRSMAAFFSGKTPAFSHSEKGKFTA
jgi:hypothetical protein